MESLAKNLKKLRQAKGLSQEGLAQRLYITRQTVSGWETGRCQPDLETLNLLAEALDTDVNELLCGTKQSTYPRYQRKYILWSSISGVIAVAYFIVWAFFLEAVREYRNQHYELAELYFFLLYGLPQVGYFATGVLIPSIYCLFHPLHISHRWRILCLCAGVAIVFPALLITIGTVCSWYPGIVNALVWHVFYPAGRAILLRALPLLSGSVIFLSCQK